MKKNLIGLILGLGLIFVISSDAFAQGRGRGGGGGNGRGNSGSQITTRGNSTNENRNNSQSNRKDVLKNGKNNNAQNNRYNGLSRKTGMSSQSLQNWYESERALNPNLTFGQFVAANMISSNHDGLSAQTILSGLRNGSSIGQVLHDQGWNEKQIKKERKRIKSNVNDDYQDRDRDWRF